MNEVLTALDNLAVVVFKVPSKGRLEKINDLRWDEFFVLLKTNEQHWLNFSRIPQQTRKLRRLQSFFAGRVHRSRLLKKARTTDALHVKKCSRSAS